MIYIWDSSIPDKWKKIVGEDHFIHISKSSKARNTLEFMAETQKYIERIRNLSKNSPAAEEFSQINQNPLQKNRNFQNTSQYTSPEEKQFREYVSPVYFPQKMSHKNEARTNEVKLPKIGKMKKFKSEVKLTRAQKGLFLEKLNEYKYTRSPRYPKPEFLYLPQALQANSNRVLNSFSSRTKNYSLSVLNSNINP